MLDRPQGIRYPKIMDKEAAFKVVPALFLCLAIIVSTPAGACAERIYYKDGRIEHIQILYRLKGTLWYSRDNGSVGIPIVSVKRVENDDGTLSKYDYENITQLIERLIAQKQYAQAVMWCDRLIEAVPDYTPVRSLRAALNQKLGNFAAATADYRYLMNNRSAGAEIYNDQGVIFAAANDYIRAKECFREAIRLMPGLAQAHANLANIFMRQKEYTGAIEEYTKVLEIEPANARALYDLGRAYSDSGDKASARTAWEKALAIDPSDAATRQALEASQG